MKKYSLMTVLALFAVAAQAAGGGSGSGSTGGSTPAEYEAWQREIHPDKFKKQDEEARAKLLHEQSVAVIKSNDNSKDQHLVK